jgi:hypothetical protein
MKKDAYQLGYEARNRNTNSDLNPYNYRSKNGRDWLIGWIDREFELFEESGLTREQWQRLMSVRLK